MASAEVTYNAGVSYRIRSHKFFRDRTQTINDEEVIARAEMTKGFSVRRLTPPGPTVAKRVMKKVVEEDAPAPKTSKKKTGKKKGLFGRK